MTKPPKPPGPTYAELEFPRTRINGAPQNTASTPSTVYSTVVTSKYFTPTKLTIPGTRQTRHNAPLGLVNLNQTSTAANPPKSSSSEPKPNPVKAQEQTREPSIREVINRILKEESPYQIPSGEQPPISSGGISYASSNPKANLEQGGLPYATTKPTNPIYENPSQFTSPPPLKPTQAPHYVNMTGYMPSSSGTSIALTATNKKGPGYTKNQQGQLVQSSVPIPTVSLTQQPTAKTKITNAEKQRFITQAVKILKYFPDLDPTALTNNKFKSLKNIANEYNRLEKKTGLSRILGKSKREMLKKNWKIQLRMKV